MRYYINLDLNELVVCVLYETRKDICSMLSTLKGNMWHVCAVEHLKEDLDAQFNFTECMLHDMSRGTLKEVATKCSVSTKVFGAISSCVTGSHGE